MRCTRREVRNRKRFLIYDMRHVHHFNRETGHVQTCGKHVKPWNAETVGLHARLMILNWRFWARHTKGRNSLILKEPGAESAPPLHFFLYLCRLLFFRAETSWLFSFKPCARFKTIFIKTRPWVMTRRCVIARWVQRKTDFPLKLHTNRVFCLFCLSGYTSTIFYLIYLVYLE